MLLIRFVLKNRIRPSLGNRAEAEITVYKQQRVRLAAGATTVRGSCPQLPDRGGVTSPPKPLQVSSLRGDTDRPVMPVDGGQLRHGIQAFAGVVKADLGTFTFCDKDSGQLMLWVTAIAIAMRTTAALPAQAFLP